MSNPPKVMWFRSEVGTEFGIEEGTPLWEEIIAPHLTADAPSEEGVDGRHGHARREEGLTPQQRENRVSALAEFYEEFARDELPYEGGECLDAPPEEVGPNFAPAPRQGDKIYRLFKSAPSDEGMDG